MADQKCFKIGSKTYTPSPGSCLVMGAIGVGSVRRGREDQLGVLNP